MSRTDALHAIAEAIRENTAALEESRRVAMAALRLSQASVAITMAGAMEVTEQEVIDLLVTVAEGLDLEGVTP